MQISFHLPWTVNNVWKEIILLQSYRCFCWNERNEFWKVTKTIVSCMPTCCVLQLNCKSFLIVKRHSLALTRSGSRDMLKLSVDTSGQIRDLIGQQGDEKFQGLLNIRYLHSTKVFATFTFLNVSKKKRGRSYRVETKQWITRLS